MAYTVGVDIAGSNNTWMTVLDLAQPSSLVMITPPKIETLKEIVLYCLNPDHDVRSIVIDSPLSYALDEERGFRSCEEVLRKNLKQNDYSADYVVSSNSLQGVVTRGRQLAEELDERGFKGKIIETVPRYCLAQLATSLKQKNIIKSVIGYKTISKKDKSGNTIINKRVVPQRRFLWRYWYKTHFTGSYNEFSLLKFKGKKDDGMIDSFVCATIGYLFHNQPNTLQLVSHIKKTEPIRGYVEGIHVLNPQHFNTF